jgi:hypothetical protein
VWGHDPVHPAVKIGQTLWPFTQSSTNYCEWSDARSELARLDKKNPKTSRNIVINRNNALGPEVTCV